MTDSASSFIAIILGLGVFLTIVAIGWRSVQHRRILRLQNADGHETIIVAREDDEISSVVSTTETTQPAVDPAPAPELGRGETENDMGDDVDADATGRDRLSRVVSSTE